MTKKKKKTFMISLLSYLIFSTAHNPKLCWIKVSNFFPIKSPMDPISDSWYVSISNCFVSDIHIKENSMSCNINLLNF